MKRIHLAALIFIVSFFDLFTGWPWITPFGVTLGVAVMCLGVDTGPDSWEWSWTVKKKTVSASTTIAINYCPKCGTPNYDIGTFACPKCGTGLTRLDEPVEQPPQPVVVPSVVEPSSIIDEPVNKQPLKPPQTSGTKKANIIVGGVVIVIFIFLILVGVAVLIGIIEKANGQSADDQLFLSKSLKYANDISFEEDQLSYAAGSYDIESMYLVAKDESSTCTDAINELTPLRVSSELQPTKDMWLSAISDDKNAADNLVTAGNEYNNGQTTIALNHIRAGTAYAKSANAKTKTATQLLQQYGDKSKPEPTILTTLTPKPTAISNSSIEPIVGVWEQMEPGYRTTFSENGTYLLEVPSGNNVKSTWVKTGQNEYTVTKQDGLKFTYKYNPAKDTISVSYAPNIIIWRT